MQLQDIIQLLEQPKRIAILSHKNPDGDAIGSSLGLQQFLQRQGHHTDVVVPTDFPALFMFMDGIEKILVSVVQREEAQEVIGKADLIFLLDLNSLDRLDNMGPMVQEAEAVKLMIDHHLDPEPCADWMMSDPSASSTCELIYRFIDDLGALDSIDATMATTLFVGLLTDTGSFKFATSSRLFHVAGELKARGAEDYWLQNKLYNSLSEKQLRLIGHCIANRMDVMPEMQSGIIYLTHEDFKKFRIQRGDTEGIVNYILMMKRMRVAVFITDQNGMIKLSFRSKGNISVQDLARAYFDGGGHKNASGGRSNKPLLATVEYVKEILPSYLATQGIGVTQ